MRTYLAIDIGASSGRHIIGWSEDGEIKTREIYRFENGVKEQDGHLIWDLERLVSEVKTGIDAALIQYPKIESLAIDTWGVDYVLLRGDEAVLPVFAYRDARTDAVIQDVHEIIPFSELYQRTGCQFQPFNSIYQIYDDLCRGRLDGVTDLLMLPEYLIYQLCGGKTREYTNATTTGLVNAASGEFDREILSRLNFPLQLFPSLSRPGTVVGEYKGIRCMLCATHDTASAVEGIPMEKNAPYISSGTWSLLGVKTERAICDENSRAANYSNEGGVGYNRYQKNIMGMWVVNELRREICPKVMFSELVALAESSTFDGIVDVNAQAFLAPKSMKEAFDIALGGPCRAMGDYFRCAYRSLAVSYRVALEELEQNTKTHYDEIYVVGGGAKNNYLNELTREITGKRVIALPIEATAIGNLKIQMEGNR
ncbi:MAG: rhamnulokinase [Oscillospiraceae bacterium]|nr:rhamnulokinase [Oscillospiraceae bacterium]